MIICCPFLMHATLVALNAFGDIPTVDPEEEEQINTTFKAN
jgi:hypothetical protein